MQDNKFEITEAAAKRIQTLILKKNNPNLLLRISVLGGGCSGFQYKYEFSDTFNSDDLFFGYQNARHTVIDEISLGLIQNSKLDYKEDLGSAGFEIINPNATARCGCGNSFSASI